MDPLSTLQIVGLIVTVLFSAALMCLATYTFNLVWILMCPCRMAYYCCGNMRYSDEDEHVMDDCKCII